MSYRLPLIPSGHEPGQRTCAKKIAQLILINLTEENPIGRARGNTSRAWLPYYTMEERRRFMKLESSANYNEWKTEARVSLI